MVFSADIRLPVRFSINRNWVSALCDESSMEEDQLIPEAENLRDARVERISVRMEDKIFYCLAHMVPCHVTEIFFEAYEPPALHA